MKAITTKYHGPSNIKGSRYSASDCDGNRVILSANDALDSDANHMAAVKALCVKMKWQGELLGGWAANGMVWVWKDRLSTPILRV
jgi:hypothetical protein